ncbi:MAG: hypothetical protein RID18_16865, partial [Cytophagales bacterium]
MKLVIRKVFLLSALLSALPVCINAQLNSEQFEPSLVPIGFNLVEAVNDDVIILLPVKSGSWLVQRKSFENELIWSCTINTNEKDRK